MARTTFQATTPSGKIVTRTSATMDYKYAIVGHDYAMGWSQSYEGALRMAKDRGGRMVPCTKKEKKQ